MLLQLLLPSAYASVAVHIFSKVLRLPPFPAHLARKRFSSPLFSYPSIAASLVTAMSSFHIVPPSPLPPTLRLLLPPSTNTPPPLWSHAVMCLTCNHLLGFELNPPPLHSHVAAPLVAAAAAATTSGAASCRPNMNATDDVGAAVASLTIDPASAATEAVSIPPPIIALRPDALSFYSLATHRHIDYSSVCSSHRRLNVPSHPLSSLPPRFSIFGTAPPPPPLDPSLSNIM